MTNAVYAAAGLFLLCIITLVGILVVLISDRVVPTELWTVLNVLVGATAGVAVPSVVASRKVTEQ